MTDPTLSKSNMVFKELTESTKKRIKDLYAEKYRIRQISRIMFLSEHVVKRVIHPDIFEADKVRRQGRKKRDYSARKRGEMSVRSHITSLNPTYDPKRDGVIFHESAFAQMQGDPLPGRSAADQKKRAEAKVKNNPRTTISLARL